RARRLEAFERRLDPRQALLEVLRAADALQPRLDAIEAVLDALQPLRHTANAPGQALEIGSRGQVERGQRRLLRPHRALARLERGRQGAAHDPVLEQFLGELADRLLALLGHTALEALFVGHCAGLYRGWPSEADPVHRLERGCPGDAMGATAIAGAGRHRSFAILNLNLSLSIGEVAFRRPARREFMRNCGGNSVGTPIYHEPTRTIRRSVQQSPHAERFLVAKNPSSQ